MCTTDKDKSSISQIDQHPRYCQRRDPTCAWCLADDAYPGYLEPGDLPPVFDSSIGWPRSWFKAVFERLGR